MIYLTKIFTSCAIFTELIAVWWGAFLFTHISAKSLLLSGVSFSLYDTEINYVVIGKISSAQNYILFQLHSSCSVEQQLHNILLVDVRMNDVSEWWQVTGKASLHKSKALHYTNVIYVISYVSFWFNSIQIYDNKANHG